MMKQTIAITLTALFAFNASAEPKITLDMAIEQDTAARAHNNSISIGALRGGMDPKALENPGGGQNWKHHWSGSTVGTVSIPSNAKDVFIVTSAGSYNFPKNIGPTVIATSRAQGGSDTVTVQLRYSGHSITGGEKTTEWYTNCSSGSQNNNSQCKKSATARITISKVMYR